jgi:hypothetical protein
VKHKAKRIRQLKARIAELEAAQPPTLTPTEPVNPHDLWRDTTAIYAQGEGDGWQDVSGYL